MGAICQYCKQDMLKADGCLYTHARKNKRSKWVPRSTDHFDEPNGRCNDCGAKHGMPHHPGCDVERCPICDMQAIGCDCDYEIGAFGRTLPNMQHADKTKDLNIYYDGPPNEKLDDDLIDLLKEHGYKCMASGFDLMNNERDLSFSTAAGTKKQTTIDSKQLDGLGTSEPKGL